MFVRERYYIYIFQIIRLHTLAWRSRENAKSFFSLSLSLSFDFNLAFLCFYININNNNNIRFGINYYYYYYYICSSIAYVRRLQKPKPNLDDNIIY